MTKNAKPNCGVAVQGPEMSAETTGSGRSSSSTTGRWLGVSEGDGVAGLVGVGLTVGFTGPAVLVGVGVGEVVPVGDGLGDALPVGDGVGVAVPVGVGVGLVVPVGVGVGVGDADGSTIRILIRGSGVGVGDAVGGVGSGQPTITGSGVLVGVGVAVGVGVTV